MGSVAWFGNGLITKNYVSNIKPSIMTAFFNSKEMNLIKMFQKLYEDLFSWAFDSELDMNRTFGELHEFHEKALPESKDKLSQTYCKIFKSKWFYLVSPLVFMYLKYLAMKYTNKEYLERLIEKDLE